MTTRVFSGPKARKCHILSALASPNSDDPALCGATPEALMWHGTGNQEEIDRAKRMNACRKCMRLNFDILFSRREES